MARIRTQMAFPVAVATCLLAATWVCQRMAQGHAADSEPYHARVRQAANSVPLRTGTWFATEEPVPPSAIALVKPNVILSRRYVDAISGQQAILLLVQCRDARDLLGHWPPVCYAGQGWVKESAAERQWQVDDLRIPGRQYEFTSYALRHAPHLSVDNFFILPGGRFRPSMDDIGRYAKGRRQRLLGAAQVQIVTDGALTEQQRGELLSLFVRASRPAIDAIREGVLP